MSPNNPAARRHGPAQLAFGSLPYSALLGCAGLAANILLSFEEPHRGMLLISLVLIAAAPVGLMIHLAFTGEMPSEDKRSWLLGFISPSGFRLFRAYFTPRERRQTTRVLSAHRRAKSGVT
jgi:hypothetical protein